MESHSISCEKELQKILNQEGVGKRLIFVSASWSVPAQKEMSRIKEKILNGGLVGNGGLEQAIFFEINDDATATAAGDVLGVRNVPAAVVMNGNQQKNIAEGNNIDYSTLLGDALRI